LGEQARKFDSIAPPAKSRAYRLLRTAACFGGAQIQWADLHAARNGRPVEGDAGRRLALKNLLEERFDAKVQLARPGMERQV